MMHVCGPLERAIGLGTLALTTTYSILQTPWNFDEKAGMMFLLYWMIFTLIGFWMMASPADTPEPFTTPKGTRIETAHLPVQLRIRCGVCHAIITTHTAVRTRCQHHFHGPCFREHNKKNKTDACPECGKQTDNIKILLSPV